MHIEPVKTGVFKTHETLYEFVIEHSADALKEKTVLAITSKIVSLSEGRVVPSSLKKEDLVKKEADHFLGEIGYGCFLTVKEGLLIASAGIDESNSVDGDFILFPENPQKTCEELCARIKTDFGLKDFGLVFTDSKTTPLRKGVTGACLSYAGFKGVQSMVGEEDLFGRKLTMTAINAADALASSAVFLMGEGGQCTPLAVITEAPLSFIEGAHPEELKIPLKEDLYYPLLNSLLED